MTNDWVTDARLLDRRGSPSLVAIGNFDGVHRGHRALLESAVARARAEGLVPVVLTFDPHPAVALGRAAPPVLTRLERKVTLLRDVAPEIRVVAQRFDEAFAAQTPDEFAERVLGEALEARAVVVGENFRFGRGESGDFETLRALGLQLGFDVRAEELVGDDRGRWSSTRVRAALATGDLEDATRVLGRLYAVEGVVAEGQRRGRTIGFPTANLVDVVETAPAHGVYAVRVERVPAPGAAGAPLADGVCNVGVRPTVAAGFSIEAHLFDFEGALYGQRLRVAFVARLRDEQKFAGLDALKAQIARDAEAARGRLKAPDAASEA